MTTPVPCPTCGRRLAPSAGVVRGLIGADTAPRLVAAWHAAGAFLALFDELPAGDLAAMVAAASGVTQKTARNLLDEGRRARLLRVRYAVDGEPVRRRAYLRLPDQHPAEVTR